MAMLGTMASGVLGWFGLGLALVGLLIVFFAVGRPWFIGAIICDERAIRRPAAVGAAMCVGGMALELVLAMA